MIREEKEKVVQELNRVFTRAKGIYLTDFTGINVDTINGLRRLFRREKSEYLVVKNTLARLSLEGLALDELQPFLNEPTGLAFSFEDALLPGKIIEKFQKETELLQIKAAVIDGTVYDRSAAEKIIKLPSREALIAKMLGSLNSPITGLVMVLNGVIGKLVYVLAAFYEKKEKEGGAEKGEEQ